MTLMSQSDFAKHIGATRGYITQLKSAGRLVMEGTKVSVEASVQRIAETQDPSKAGVAERHQQERAQKQDPFDAVAGKTGGSYQQAKTMREKYNGLMAKVAYEKEIGLLLDADEARAAVSSGDAIIRNRLEALPDMLAPQLAAESDEQKIRSLLMDQVEYLLSDLSRIFNGMAKA
jgi:hypothetical protein